LNEKGKRVIVLDTSALIAGFDPFSINEDQYAPPKVREEINEDNICWVRFKTALENGRVKIHSPTEQFVKKARSHASNLGDSFLLSETDIQVLSVALELKAQGKEPMIATDDYSIQNVATAMGIEFVPLSNFGIRRRLQWIRYCPACHKKYPADYASGQCEVCGTKLKRKAKKNAQSSLEGKTMINTQGT
jgi:UPF0271 protein